MNRPPHPVLRRLYALAAVPSAAVAGVGRALAALTRTARDCADAPVLSDRALQPLVQAIDLSALFKHALERVREQSSGGAPLEPPRPGQRRARPAVSARSRPPEATPSPGPEVVAAVQDRLAGAQREAAARVGEPAGAVAPAPSRAWPRARRAGNEAAADTPIGAAADPTPQDPSARASPSGSASPGGPPGITTRLERTLDRLEVVTPRREIASGEPPLPSRVAALAALYQRARRAGNEAAAGTPIGAAAATAATVEGTGALDGARPMGEGPTSLAAVTALLAAADPTLQDPSARASPSGSPGPGGAPGITTRLERTLDRLDVVTPRREIASDDTTDRRQRPPSARFAAYGGLRRLAAVAAGGRQPKSRMTVRGSDGESAAPDFVAERMAEAELTRRIAALLEREARRQGIELEGPPP